MEGCEKWFPEVLSEIIWTLVEVYVSQGDYFDGEYVLVLWTVKGKNFYNLSPNIWIILRIYVYVYIIFYCNNIVSMVKTTNDCNLRRTEVILDVIILEIAIFSFNI